MTSLISALGTAFSSIQEDFMSVVGTALPIALGIVGVGIAITLGIKYFKKISKG